MSLAAARFVLLWRGTFVIRDNHHEMPDQWPPSPLNGWEAWEHQRQRCHDLNMEHDELYRRRGLTRGP